jgi:glycosyltransferase involved in cell wall biosynthesis
MLMSWARHHGRTDALSKLLHIDSKYVYPEVRLPGPRLLSTTIRYLLSSVLTVIGLFRARRDDRTVIVVTPPVFPVLLARLILRPNRLIIDAHSGAFVGARWTWSTPLLRRSCRNIAALIVTNEEILQDDPLDCPVIVLHDPFEEWPETPSSPEDAHVLVPLGGGDDEPVRAIVAAARASDRPFVFCGRTSPSDLPSNARATGFVTAEEYRQLVNEARVVVGVTDRDFTMQRVGYEAMFAGRALVTSDFEVLRRFFADAAVYVEPNDATSIAAGVSKAWASAEALEEHMRSQREIRAAEQDAALDRLRLAVGQSGHET